MTAKFENHINLQRSNLFRSPSDKQSLVKKKSLDDSITQGLA